MTAAKPSCGKPPAAKHPVAAERLDRILGTARVEAAGGRQQRAQRIAIGMDRRADGTPRQTGQRRHGLDCARHGASRESARPMRRSSSRRQRRFRAPRGSSRQPSSRRRSLIIARSGRRWIGQSASRQASRATRLSALRSTARGSRRLGTDMPSRHGLTEAPTRRRIDTPKCSVVESVRCLASATHSASTRGRPMENDGPLAGRNCHRPRRLRPLARRARITARPPRVFMRTRKPCVRLRRTTEGW